MSDFGDQNPYQSSVAGGQEVFDGGGVTPKTIEMLRQTRFWVLILAVIGFIFAGLMLFGGGCWGVVLIAAGLAGTGMPPGGILNLLGVLFYLAFGLSGFFLALYLYRYGSRIGAWVREGTSQHLDSALEAQRSFWRLFAIVIISFISLYIIMMIGTFAIITSRT